MMARFARKILNLVLRLVAIIGWIVIPAALLVELLARHEISFSSYELLHHLHQQQTENLNLMLHFLFFFYSEESLKKMQIRTC